MCTQIVHKSITHNSQKIENPQMSIYWQNVVQPYNEILFIHEKDYIHAITWINLENMLSEKKARSKVHVLDDSIYMKFPE